MSFAKENSPVSATVVQLKPPDAPPEKLEALFCEHKAMIFRAAYRITGSANEAEDVLQTIFLRLMQQGSDFQTSSDEKLTAAYMHRAAINCSLDIVRRRQHAPSVPLDEIPPAYAHLNSLSPELAHEEQELRRLLQEAVARLNPKSAEVFVLRYFEGKTNREIADALQTSPLVVAVMLHRARTRLRAEVGEFLEKHHETK
jgi:RNA polymerase sigma-70 factor (ECF subfamily)